MFQSIAPLADPDVHNRRRLVPPHGSRPRNGTADQPRRVLGPMRERSALLLSLPTGVAMTEPISPPRLSTGVDGLDRILVGGLPVAGLYLLEGEAGSGKTTLALQFLQAGVARQEPTLLVAFSETLDELATFAASHGWSLAGIEIMDLSDLRRIFGETGQQTMFHSSEIEFTEVIERIRARIHEAPPDPGDDRQSLGATPSGGRGATIPPAYGNAQAEPARARQHGHPRRWAYCRDRRLCPAYPGARGDQARISDARVRPLPAPPAGPEAAQCQVSRRAARLRDPHRRHHRLPQAGPGGAAPDAPASRSRPASPSSTRSLPAGWIAGPARC